MDSEAQPMQIKSSPMAAPMYNFGSSILYLTNPDSELFKMELTLRGQRTDKDGNVKNIGGPLLNEEGINSVIGMVQTIVNQCTVMSNLKKTEIPMLIDFLADTLAKDLMINRKKYEMSYASRNKIFFAVITSAFITMNRALEEGEKRFWKGSVQEIKSTVESSMPNRGIMSRINPWGRR